MDDGNTDEQFAAAGASVDQSPQSKYERALKSHSPTPATDDDATTKPVPPVDADSSANGYKMNASVDTSAEVDVKLEATPQTTPAVNEVDLDQCRVCLTKTDLVDIFSLGYVNMRICDIVMTVCRVKILERDHLPNFLCITCVDKVSAALCFKNACEAADVELRSKLKRSKKTVRHSRSDYILVDCKMSSSDEEVFKTDGAPAGSTIKIKDEDDDFRISDVEAEEASLASESSDSNYKMKSSVGGSKRIGRPRVLKPKLKKSPTATVTRRKSFKSSSYKQDYSDNSDDDWTVSEPPPPAPPTPKRGRGRPRKSAAAATPLKSAPEVSTVLASSTPTSRIPPKKRALRNADTSDDDEYRVTEKKSLAAAVRKEHPCPYCDEVFATAERLKEHKKKYIGQKPLTCTTCGKMFKQRTSFEVHVSRHQEDAAKRHCADCDLTFATRIELRRHDQTTHGMTFVCEQCRRPFTSQARLDQHSAGKCAAAKKMKLEPDVRQALRGGDLFKSVAPLTTTYWSDSFSD